MVRTRLAALAPKSQSSTVDLSQKVNMSTMNVTNSNLIYHMLHVQYSTVQCYTTHERSSRVAFVTI